LAPNHLQVDDFGDIWMSNEVVAAHQIIEGDVAQRTLSQAPQ
jgi:hypothetical protein